MEEKNKDSILDIIKIGGAFIGGFVFLRFFGIETFFLVFIVVVLSFIFTSAYLRKEKLNNKLINFIAWANLFAWIFPILGIIVFVAAFVFASSERLEGRKRYKILAIIGLVLTVAAVFISIYIIKINYGKY